MSFRWLAVAGLVAAAATGCSRRLEGADGSVPGKAVDALAGTYCITDVEADARTYHFDSPRFLLQADEGAGPRTLAVTIDGYAAPLVTTTLSQPPPKDDDLSVAVGYSLAKFYYVQASAAFTVDIGEYKKLEAYINYARSAFVVREAGCGAVLGTGISFKPIGVYFAARDTVSVTIPGTSVVSFLPDGTAEPGGYEPGPDLASLQASDAGTTDAGAADAGTSDAGGP